MEKMNLQERERGVRERETQFIPIPPPTPSSTKRLFTKEIVLQYSGMSRYNSVTNSEISWDRKDTNKTNEQQQTFPANSI